MCEGDFLAEATFALVALYAVMKKYQFRLFSKNNVVLIRVLERYHLKGHGSKPGYSHRAFDGRKYTVTPPMNETAIRGAL